MKLQNEDATFAEYWFTMALTTVPKHCGNLDPVSQYVQVKFAPAAIALQVCSVGNIVSCAHVIPEIAIGST
jgi:hypothetical protein